MSFILADRVQETTTTTGTGTLTLAGASAQYQTFASGVGSGNTTYYGLLDGNGTAWEIGLGTIGSGTLARTTIFASTNSNAAISLSSNTHSVYCDAPAKLLNGQAAYNVPSASSFGWINQNGGTLTDNAGGPLVYQNTTNAGGDQFSIATLPVSGAFTATAQCSWIQCSGYGGIVPIGVTDGTKLLFIDLYNATSWQSYIVQEWNSYNSFQSNLNSSGSSWFPNPSWFRVSYDGTSTSTFYYSPDGFTWIDLGTSTFLTPTDIIIGSNLHTNETYGPNTISYQSLVLT